MSAAYGNRRAFPSTLNTPTTVRVRSSSSIPQSQAESLLTEFIDASEFNNNPVNQEPQSQKSGMASNSGNAAVLSQLRRIQRNLRGLPPLEPAPQQQQQHQQSSEQKPQSFDANNSNSSMSGEIAGEGSKNKKIVFED
ncbi:hypothetical protein PVL30_004525 [Lodderomyces elongisporus]|uniref:uncharacterized protein n=1 Tax=Lodderomyces elongisporus TaxID=36914 RepID=UPI00292209C0|nr:uncharacterized protein PVL30_004525 [Lodderomyces elongisporus]WLF80737.1 hypothetical protein PVL30_004525 [Lodderomyces elongisporus]